MQNSLKYFLEILQNRKSDTLEWIIIVLIAGEICVSMYDILGLCADGDVFDRLGDTHLTEERRAERGEPSPRPADPGCVSAELYPPPELHS